LFVDLTATELNPLVNVGNGTNEFELSIQGDLDFFSADGVLTFTGDVGNNAGDVDITVGVEISNTAGNILVIDGGGLFVPTVADVTTGFSYSLGVYTYTDEAAATYNIDVNATNLRALDNQDILGGGAGALSDVQTLLDELANTLTGIDVLTSIEYNDITNELTYTDELGADTILILDGTSGGATDIQGVNNSSITTNITGTGTTVDPFLIEGLFTAGLGDLSDVSLGTPSIGHVLTWTGSAYVPQSLSVTDTNAYTHDVSLSGNILRFTSGGTPGLNFNGTVDLSTITPVSVTDSYVSGVVLNGTTLEFTGVSSAFNSDVPLASLVSGGYGFSIEDKDALSAAVIDTDILKITSSNDLISTKLTSAGSPTTHTITLLIDAGSDGQVLTWDGPGADVVWQTPATAGTMSSFDIVGDTGSETVINAESIQFTGAVGSGITTAVTGGELVTFDWTAALTDLSDITAYPGSPPNTNYLLNYNTTSGNSWKLKGDVITADNGLTGTDGNIQLGGALLGNTTITVPAAVALNIDGFGNAGSLLTLQAETTDLHAEDILSISSTGDDVNITAALDLNLTGQGTTTVISPDITIGTASTTDVAIVTAATTALQLPTDSDPSGNVTGPTNGMIKYDTTSNILMVYIDGAWNTITTTLTV
jgi:hypothetical protein